MQYFKNINTYSYTIWVKRLTKPASLELHYSGSLWSSVCRISRSGSPFCDLLGYVSWHVPTGLEVSLYWNITVYMWGDEKEYSSVGHSASCRLVWFFHLSLLFVQRFFSMTYILYYDIKGLWATLRNNRELMMSRMAISRDWIFVGLYSRSWTSLGAIFLSRDKWSHWSTGLVQNLPILTQKLFFLKYILILLNDEKLRLSVVKAHYSISITSKSLSKTFS